MLFSKGDVPEPVMELMPWLEFRTAPLEEVSQKLETQTHRRCITTHLPLDGVPFFDAIKYVVVEGDARDVFMSLLNHYGSNTPELFEMMNNAPGRIGDHYPAL